MKVELEHDSDQKLYWIAKIVGDFGQMLSLQWEKGKDSFFFDLGEKKRFYPIGYYRRADAGYKLQPPLDLKIGENAADRPAESLSPDASSEEDSLLPLALFAAGGLKTSLFRVNDVIHVSLEGRPLTFWFATIVRNVGGRLLLQWILQPDAANEKAATFWLFYSHPRVIVPGSSAVAAYEPPVTFDDWMDVRDKNMRQTSAGDDRLLLQDLMIRSAQQMRPALLHESSDSVVNHTALIFPSNILKLVPAKIEETIDQKCFKVSALAGSEKVCFWYPQDDSNCILPISWAEANEIPIDGQVQQPALLKLMLHERIEEFKNNGKIEVVDPQDANRICEAVIIRVTPPLIWIQISADRIRILPFNSTDMFPSGWAEDNGCLLNCDLPTPGAKSGTREGDDVVPEDARATVLRAAEIIPKAWCPRIYFNYKCFTGPSLSKSKLRNLPRFVGPGPVLLVMQEVISKILSIAYVSSRILNELASEQFMEMLVEHKIVKTQGIEFKARYNNSQKTARMDIPIIRNSEKVEEFCHIICAHLKCCFNLFGPKLYDGDNCPSNCRGLTKSNKVLKRADYYRQQAIAAKQYLAGESEMPNFESLKEPVKGPGRGRGRAKRPVESNSNSGASDEEKVAAKKQKKKPGRPKKVKAVVDEEEKDETQSSCSKTHDDAPVDEVPNDDEEEDDNSGKSAKSASGEKENTNRKKENKAALSSDNPLSWNVNKVHKFLARSRFTAVASHFRDHVSTRRRSPLRSADRAAPFFSCQEIDGPALLLLDEDTIASSVMTGYTLKFTERDVVGVSQLISRLRKTWHRRFRS